MSGLHDQARDLAVTTPYSYARIRDVQRRLTGPVSGDGRIHLTEQECIKVVPGILADACSYGGSVDDMAESILWAIQPREV